MKYVKYLIKIFILKTLLQSYTDKHFFKYQKTESEIF